MKFENLNLIGPLLDSIREEGYETPTPVQAQAIPLVLAGRDLLACAQTGSGKTAAFALPILQLLATSSAAKGVRVLVLTPTRELASQVGESFAVYGKKLSFRHAIVFGGVAQKPQVRALRSGVEIVIGTPGRLLDLLQQRQLNLRNIEVLVLDEADRMLDMGFIQDVRKIISALPKKRQTVFFSATMPPEISKLSQQILAHPARIEVSPVSSTVETVQQYVYFSPKKMKDALLVRLLEDEAITRALVFTRTKRDANRVTATLNRAKIKAESIHGDKSQSAREQALSNLKKGCCRILVATDVAARGIDIEQVTHVFNHDIPNISETYVHRIGRTARAGAEGVALSFCAVEERGFLADIEKLIHKEIAVLQTPEGLEIQSHRPPRPPRAATAAAGQKRTYFNPPPSPNNRKQRRKKAR